ncbi:MAG: ATP-binding cassette domain-containing protein [Crocinitomicaceae bacterium]
MSERILKALMQLFAIIAKVDDVEDEVSENEESDVVEEVTSSKGRKIVELLLNQELSADLVEEYLVLFDEYLNTHHAKSAKKKGKRKRTSVNSVKVLKICTQINEELAQKQKVVVLVRLLEFINANDIVTEQELEFVETVADTFNIDREEFGHIKQFVDNNVDKIDSPYFLYINNKKEEKFSEAKHIYNDTLIGDIRILRVTSVNVYFFKVLNEADLYLNGQIIPEGRHQILNQGSSIRSSRVKPIYYSDIIGRYLSDKNQEKIVFEANHITYRFKAGNIGLHDFNFRSESGKLVGIMGGSGAGKSTLLNVLNGNNKPSTGTIKINGYDIHKDTEEIEGVIGYVSQDDLLIEELTVFQNLFYNAKLCFGNLNNKQISEKVLDLLNSLGLYEARDLKVGSPLDKYISGGQRKRLNIALELIREPSVMFVDEPTSGLSSRDSENIMDLLKELSLKGKVIFVVIHQPSSDIFKMFDDLMILDKGGYPIYNANPVDGVVYFKKAMNHANADESDCPTCGNVNPEQIFNIIDAKVVDEYGNQTDNRKVSPEEWNKRYKETEFEFEPLPDKKKIPDSIFKIPNILKQFYVYFIRDILSKLTNKQYMVINMVEAPALAAILAFFVRFYNTTGEQTEYVFRKSENLPQFLFISVVVALFIGLTVAAEEIIKDQKILKRESFLNLSKGSYLASKIIIMILISAIQTLFFVLVGNIILEIKGMWLEYWLILFSVSVFANILGLNISASFNSAKVVYILIPILIIPQLLFSGVIVKFEKLNPLISSKDSVPLIGNVMCSRWAYEALAVTQFKENDLQKKFYEFEQTKSFASWKRDYWIPELVSALDNISNYKEDPEKKEVVDKAFMVLKNEIQKEEAFIQNLQCKGCMDGLTRETFAGEKTVKPIKLYLNTLKKHYNAVYTRNDRIKDSIIMSMGVDTYKEEVKEFTNESLDNFCLNKTDLTNIIEYEGHLVQKSDPIYKMPDPNKGFFGAHFYAPKKFLFGKEIDTFWANLIVIWGMSFLLIITLYFDVFKKLIDGIERSIELVSNLGRSK